MRDTRPLLLESDFPAVSRGALDTLQVAVDRWPSGTADRELLGVALQRAGKSDAAAKQFVAALEEKEQKKRERQDKKRSKSKSGSK